MAATLLRLALLAAAASSAFAACAFPTGACVPNVCGGLNLPDFNALLNPSLFYANDSGILTTFGAVPKSLAFYFGQYNDQSAVGPSYDGSKTANRDGAPFLNYFELRSSLGYLAKTGVSMQSCCNSCRRASGCTMYLFNPYINTNNNNGVKTKSFRSTGDCYYLLQSDSGKLWTYDKVKAACNVDSSNSLVDSTVKPYFYAGTCNGNVADDPHFVGAHGTRYDFNGELDRSFCLLADSQVQLNALLRGYEAPNGEKNIRSWMKELGVVWADAQGSKHTLHLVARAGKQQERGAGFLAAAVLDGQALEKPENKGDSISGADMELQFLGVGQVGKLQVDQYRLKVGDLLDLSLNLRVAHPKLQTPEDAEVHFNLGFNSIKVTDTIHGVLGQTYRNTAAQEQKAIKFSALSKILGAPVQADGKTGKGFLEGETADYVTSSIVSADCKFSSFAA